jgi:hypothetical protein
MGSPPRAGRKIMTITKLNLATLEQVGVVEETPLDRLPTMI